MISVFDQILRTGKSDVPVDDHDLAVVTQIDTVPLVVKGLCREHLVDWDTCRPQTFQDGSVISKVAEVVDQHPALDAARLGAAQRVKDWSTNGIIGKHEILEVDVGLGRLDILHDATD